ncbi:MAG TPA: thioredoxin fold domain-containing protein [Gammaproteobacteria bacterium]|nr:thioredoxin fold domain-containing protein [Gammaproteobacteria bacterium]
MKRLYKSALLGCALFCLGCSSLRAEVEIPVATDLQADGRLAREARLPILLTFSAIVCEYCRQLEDQFLRPMLISGEYTDRTLIRRLLLDNGSRVIDFSGKRIAVTQLSDRYKVFVTPTTLFLDGDGNEIAARMTGINTPELYGGYLDNCIATALYTIRDPGKLAQLHGCRLQENSGAISPAVP